MKRTRNLKSLAICALLLVVFTGLNLQTAQAAALKTPGNFTGRVTLPINPEDYEGDPNDLTGEEQTELFAMTKLTITWDAVLDADGYEVYYRSNFPGEDTWEDWQVTKTKETSAQGSIIDGSFQMRVRAYKGSQYSNYTEIITVEGGNGIIDTPAVKLNKTKATIYVGKTSKLSLKNATASVTWKSSDSKIATVKNGLVTAKKQGSCTITATSDGKSYTCKVTVKKVTAKVLYSELLEKKEYTYNINYGTYETQYKMKMNYFICLDINNDGVKELIVSNANKATAEDWGYVYKEDALVFTVKNDKLKYLGHIYSCIDQKGLMYNKKYKGIISEMDAGSGGRAASYDIYNIKNNALKELYHCDWSYDALEGSGYYAVGGKKTTEKKYQAYFKKYFNQNDYKHYTLTENTEANRNKIK